MDEAYKHLKLHNTQIGDVLIIRNKKRVIEEIFFEDGHYFFGFADGEVFHIKEVQDVIHVDWPEKVVMQ